MQGNALQSGYAAPSHRAIVPGNGACCGTQRRSIEWCKSLKYELREPYWQGSPSQHEEDRRLPRRAGSPWDSRVVGPAFISAIERLSRISTTRKPTSVGHIQHIHEREGGSRFRWPCSLLERATSLYPNFERRLVGRETPRLCRGGSRSLTFPAVFPRHVRRHDRVMI